MPIVQLGIAMQCVQANFAMNIMHFNCTFDASKTDLANLLSLIDVFRADVEDSYKACLPDNVVIKNYSAKKVTDGGSVTQMLAVDVAGVGDVSAALAGAGMDLAINTNDVNNRWGHVYTPAIPGSFINDGVWQASAFAAAGSFFTAIKAEMHWATGGTAQFGTFHRKTATFSPMLDGSLRTKPVLMNKRLKPVL